MQVAVTLLLWRGPEPLHTLPLPSADVSSTAAAADGAATPQKGAEAHELSAPDAVARTAASAAADGSPERGRGRHLGPSGNDFSSPLELQHTCSMASDGSQKQGALASEDSRSRESAEPAAADAQQQSAARQRFRRDSKQRRRRGGGRAAAAFLAWLATGCCILALLSDLALRRFPEHSCGVVLR